MKITGYSDKISARPGETIQFMVNCEPPSYEAEVVRIICGDTNPAGPGVKEKVISTPVNGTYKGRKQVIEAGSYVTIPTSPVLEQLESFSVQTTIWPTTPEKSRQIILAKFSERAQSGFALMIAEDGSLALMLGDGKGKAEVFSTGKRFLTREWYFVAASYDAKTQEMVLYQEPLTHYPLADDAGEVRTKAKTKQLGKNQAQLTMAAFRSGSGNRTTLAARFNGKIDRPCLVNRVLSRAEMEMLKAGPAPASLTTAVVGSWDFSRDISSLNVTDTSPNRLHGQVVNMPARGMKGYNWNGTVMSWQEAPDQYGAIHFHEDDVYDAGWSVDFALNIPANMQSGLYAVRLCARAEEEYIPFVVKPRKGEEKKIAFLLPTASYMAYANDHSTTNVGLVQLLIGRLPTLDDKSLFLAEHREYGASCYDSHADGSGVCYSSRLRPILNMRPKHISPLGGHGSSLWQFNADTHITDWLEAMGYEFDVITERGLRLPAILATLRSDLRRPPWPFGSRSWLPSLLEG